MFNNTAYHKETSGRPGQAARHIANAKTSGTIFTMLTDAKQTPSDAWIEGIRARFPVEREIDQALTRKLQRRAGGRYQSPSQEELHERLTGFLASRIAGDFAVRDFKPLAGGASKEQFDFRLDWTKNGQSREADRLVLRMEPGESLVETSRLREFQVLKAFDGAVPVPRVYWVDPDGSELGQAALICGFVDGVTKPSDATPKVSGLGTNLGPVIRERLADQIIGHLAGIHTLDWRTADLSAFDTPRAGSTEAALWEVNHWARVWAEDAIEDLPLVALAETWLRGNLPQAEKTVVVHADYRTGNYLFNEEKAEITAILDWELAHLGDYHEDLGWAFLKIFGHYDEDGKTFLPIGLVPRDAFIERYEKASGNRVDPKTLAFYEILAAWKVLVLILGTSLRITYSGKSHQPALVNYLANIGHYTSEILHRLFEEHA